MGHFSHIDKFKEHFNQGFFTLNNIDGKEKCLLSVFWVVRNEDYFLFVTENNFSL